MTDVSILLEKLQSPQPVYIIGDGPTVKPLEFSLRKAAQAKREEGKHQGEFFVIARGNVESLFLKKLASEQHFPDDSEPKWNGYEFHKQLTLKYFDKTDEKFTIISRAANHIKEFFARLKLIFSSRNRDLSKMSAMDVINQAKLNLNISVRHDARQQLLRTRVADSRSHARRIS